MTARQLLVASALVALAPPARAQLAPRSVALEALASTPVGRGVPAHAAQAVTATTWLDGSCDLALRVSTGAAPRTADRAAARWYAGTAGLRWSLGRGPVRPQVGVEAGWAGRGGGGSRLLLGAAAALEWFPARDLALRAEGALRGAPGAGAWRAELGLAAALYF